MANEIEQLNEQIAELSEEVADLKHAVSQLASMMSKVDSNYHELTDKLVMKTIERLNQDNGK